MFSLDSYLPLIGIPFLIFAALLFALAARKKQENSWAPLFPLLRCLALCALLIALSKPHISYFSEGHGMLFFLLDVSKSIPQEEKARALERMESILDSHSGGQTVLVLFAGKAHLARRNLQKQDLQDPSLLKHIFWEGEGPALPEGVEGDVNREFAKSIKVNSSNPAAAFSLAKGLRRKGQPSRGFIFTDGNFENWSEFASAASSPYILPGFPIHGIPLLERGWIDAIAWKLQFPEKTKEGDAVEVSLLFRSNSQQQGVARLLVDGKKVETAPIETVPGKEGRVTFPPLSLSRGRHHLEGVIEIAGDGRHENNRTQGVLEVSPPNRILFLGKKGLLSEALELQELPIQVEPDPERAASSLAVLREYGCVVLALSDATEGIRLPFEPIKRYVEELGGGLLVVAGSREESYGRLCSSPLGELLPLNSLPYTPPPPPVADQDEKEPETKEPQKEQKPTVVKKKGKAATVALLLLIDKSGSMAGEKMDLAKESAIASAETLHPKDLLGVIAFDSLPHWLLNFTEAGDRVGIIDQLTRLKASGGTRFFPAFREAYNALRKTRARVKHILFLTDGESNEFKDFETLLTAMARKGITLSAVGVGSTFNEAVLGSFAMWGDGKFYPAFNFRSIPQIFALDVARVVEKGKQTELPEIPDVDPRPFLEPEREEKPEPVLLERDKVKEKELFPVWIRHPSPLIAGIDEADLPAIGGYHPCEEKFLSYSILEAGRGEPLLTAWNFGLGRVLVWASEGEGDWMEEWEKWPDYARFWSRMVSWLKAEEFRNAALPKVTVTTESRGAERILATWSGSEEIPIYQAVLHFPSGRREKILLKREGSHRAGAPICSHEEQGLFILTWEEKVQDSSRSHSKDLTFSFSPPWELSRPGGEFIRLKELIETSGGRWNPPIEEVLPFPGEEEENRKELISLFLILGLVFFLLDLLARKVAE